MAKKTSSVVKKDNPDENLPDDTSAIEEDAVLEEVPVVKKARVIKKKAAKSDDKAAVKAPAKRAKRRTDDGSADSVPVMKAYWGVYNPMMVQVAQYDYAEESEAQKAAADMTEKKKAPHFVQLIKKVV